MGKYAVHRIDNNAEPLYEFLEAHGVSVHRIGRPLDAICAAGWATALVEVKRGKARLRPGQAAFLRSWPGLAMVLRTEADCLVLKRLLQDASSGRPLNNWNATGWLV